MKRASTLFLKTVLIVIGTVVFAGCAFSFLHVWRGAAIEWPALLSILYVGLIGIYASVFPFLFALFQAYKLLQYIDTNNAFSELSIKALQHIMYSAITMSAFYAAALPLAFTFAELDDAPGVVVLSTAFACAPLVVAVFAAVLKKLVQNALDMKAEIDLTV